MMSDVAAFRDAAHRVVRSNDGIDLAVYDRGGNQGARVFLSHATGFCATAWAAVAEDLGALPWTAWDYRGHGRSGGGTIPVSWWSMGFDAGAVRDATPVERAIGVGHSMGGAALLMAQLFDPRRFDALILFEPIVFPGPFRRVPEVPLAAMARKRRARFDTRQAALDNYRHKPPFDSWDRRALVGYLATGLTDTEDVVELSCAPEYEAEVFTASGASGVLDRLGEIDIPVWILAGADTDTYPTLDWPAVLAGSIPQGRAELIPGTGHFAPMDLPSAIVDRVMGLMG